MASLYRALEMVPHYRPHAIASSPDTPNAFSVVRHSGSVVMQADTSLGVTTEPVRLFVNTLSKTVEDMKKDPSAIVSVSFRHLNNHKTLEVTVKETPGRNTAVPAGLSAYSHASFYSSVDGSQTFGESYSGPSTAYTAAELAANLHHQLEMHDREHFNVVARVETPEKNFLDEAEAGFLISAAMLNDKSKAALSVQGTEQPKLLSWRSSDVRALLKEAQTSKYLQDK